MPKHTGVMLGVPNGDVCVNKRSGSWSGQDKTRNRVYAWLSLTDEACATCLSAMRRMRR